MCDILEVRDICLSMPEAEETQCFGEDFAVFKVRGKMFAMLMFLPRYCNWVFLKCDHDYAITLRDEYQEVIEGAYHMNKRYWNMVDFTHPSVSADFLRHLIAHSYNEVLAKMSRPHRAGLEPLPEGIVTR